MTCFVDLLSRKQYTHIILLTSDKRFDVFLNNFHCPWYLTTDRRLENPRFLSLHLNVTLKTTRLYRSRNVKIFADKLFKTLQKKIKVLNKYWWQCVTEGTFATDVSCATSSVYNIETTTVVINRNQDLCTSVNFFF